MNCKQAENSMVDYLYGELSPEDRKAFEQHLQGCAVHARETEKLSSMLDLMREQKPEEVPEQLSDRILHLAKAACDQQTPARRSPWYLLLRSPVAAAAILVGVVVTVGLAVTQLSSDIEEATPQAASEAIQPVTAPAMNRGQKLADEQTAGIQAPEEKKAAKQETDGEARSLDKAAPGDRYRQFKGKTRVAAATKKPRRSMKMRTAPKPKKKAALRGAGVTLAGREAEEKSISTTGDLDFDDSKAGKVAEPKKSEDGAGGHRFSAPPPPRATTTRPAPKPIPTAAAPSSPEAEEMVEEMAGEMVARQEAPASAGVDQVAVKTAKRSARKDSRDRKAQALDSYRQGESHLSAKNYPQALSAFRNFLARHPGDSRARTCRYRIAKTLFLLGRCRQAIVATRQAISASARHAMAPAALLDLASCHIRLNQFEAARSVYRQIEKDYPAYRQDARQGLRRIERR